MSTTIPRTCFTCGASFLADSREVTRGNAKYCGLRCSGKRTRPTPEPNCVCSTCGAQFYRAPSKIRASKSGHMFCDRLCKEKAQRLGGIPEIQPSHYGEGPVDYRTLAKESLEQKCCRCGYDHYLEVLEVHHIDNNHSNNDIANLAWVCPTCHMEIHFETKTGRWGSKKRDQSTTSE